MENGDVKGRWDNYRKANTDRPLARKNELETVFNLLNPKEGERIFEVGTGNGYLTFPIARAVGSGKIVTADVNEGNLKSVAENNLDKLPIETYLFADDSLFAEIEENSFDVVTTIATLHHFDNRKKETGETGRIRALRDFYKILKQDGRLVMADVADHTISQRYFDAIDTPELCFPEGHPHDFFTEERLAELLGEIGFKKIKIEIKSVPWRFGSLEEAKKFIHTLHNAKCSEEQSFRVAEDILGLKKVGDHYELAWELFFVEVYK